MSSVTVDLTDRDNIKEKPQLVMLEMKETQPF